MNNKTTKGINYYEGYTMEDYAISLGDVELWRRLEHYSMEDAAMAGDITAEEYYEWAADDIGPDYSFIRNTDHEDYAEDCMAEYKEICEESPFNIK